MGLEGKRIAILVEDDYQMHEFWYPFYRMQEAGAEVRVIGTGRESYASHGYAVKPDLQATEANVDAAPPAKAMPSVRLTVLPLASVLTNVRSRESLTRCA